MSSGHSYAVKDHGNVHIYSRKKIDLGLYVIGDSIWVHGSPYEKFPGSHDNVRILRYMHAKGHWTTTIMGMTEEQSTIIMKCYAVPPKSANKR